VRRIRISTFLFVFFLMVSHRALGAAAACDLNATTANFSAQIAAATAGQTVCLATGDYGTWTGVSKTSPGVTITAAAGAVPRISLAFQGPSTRQWMIIDGLTVYGIVDWTAPTTNVTVRNSTITGKINIWAAGPNNACSNCGSMNNANIVFDNDLFNFADNNQSSFEGRFNLLGTGGVSAGVTVKNSQFTTGCADGVHVAGGGNGETIGPGNTFFNLQQGSCGPHVDSIQFEGSDSPGPVITGNFFHNESTGIVGYDNANSATITNNVLINIDQDAMELGGFDSNTTVEHNTVIGQAIDCGVTHEGNVCKAVFRNNIADSVTAVGGGTGQPSFNDYNLCVDSGCVGSHSLHATPTFVGGANSSTYAGFGLTSLSPGHNAASDGKDMGINITTGGPAPPPTATRPDPPTNLQAIVQ
jgi:Right handed beta helix region